MYATDNARTVYVAGSMKLSDVRLFVCPSVRPVIRSPHVAAAGLLLWARRPEDIDRLLHGRRSAANANSVALSADTRGVVGRGRGGRRPPLFFDRGTRPPLLPFFGLKFVQKLVHCCNWLLTETQCKIISVQQNFSDVYECTRM